MSSIALAEPTLGQQERQRVLDVLGDGHLADGPVVRRFESAFADRCGVERGVATSNGTTALHAALRGLGIGAGDNVVTTPFSFIATANAIRLCGATPVFADIDPETYNLDPDAVEAAIRAVDGDVSAILVAHLYGLPAEVQALDAIADRYDAALVEDAAQAHGARFDGRPVGSFGDVACFSFYPTKNMTTGEGGLVVTDRDEIANRVERFVNHGRTDSDTHVEVGHNFRMSSIAGAIGLAQLDRLDSLNRSRRANADRLTAGLQDVPGLDLPVEPPDRRHVFHQYAVRYPDRDRLRDRLDECGIETGVYYPTPIHEQPAYSGVDHRAPVAEQAAREVLTLPVHPGLTDADIDEIVAGVRETVSEECEVAGQP